MKYAPEIIEVMSAFPGRRFKVRHLTRVAVSSAVATSMTSARRQVQRVLAYLEELGQVCSTRGEVGNGEDAEYWWEQRYAPLRDCSNTDLMRAT